MMKFILLLLALPVMMSETCKEKSADKNSSSQTGNTVDEMASIPSCIQSKIDSIKKLPRFNPPAEVTEYEMEGKRVFLFSSDCCDFFNTLVDAKCNYVCAPSGGFTGKGDGKCPDFDKKAKMIKQVWKDPR